MATPRVMLESLPAKLDYNIIKYLRKTRTNISLFKLWKLTTQRELIAKAFTFSLNPIKPAASSKGNTVGRSPVVVDLQAIVNAANTNSRGSTPPFLLTFEMFNFNVHNYLVDSGTSTNVMPWSVCKKLNVQPEKTDAKIIQLDRSQVPAIRELNNVIIQLSSDAQAHQCIDIIVIDIPEAYGLLLSRDWYCKLQGYFATDWSHLLLPYKGKNNQIRVNSEPCMKHIVSDLEISNEPISYAQQDLQVCLLESSFGCYHPQTSTVSSDTQIEIPTQTPSSDDAIFSLTCIHQVYPFPTQRRGRCPMTVPKPTME